MRDAILAFLECPSGETYLAARSALVASPAYLPYSDDLASVEELLEQGRFIDADEMLAQAMSHWFLTPRAHLYAAMIAEKLDDEDRAKMEGAIACACAEGILSTGEGTQESPYLVTRVADEYDVLQYLGKQMEQQSLMELDDRYFDLIRCDDGSEIWFDITDPKSRLLDRAPDDS